MLARILKGIAAWPVLGLVALVFVLFVAQSWRSDQWHLREHDRAAPVDREAVLLPGPPSTAARAEAASPVVAPASTWEPYYDLRFRSSRFPTLWDGTPAPSGAFRHVAVGDVTGDGRQDIVTIGQTEEWFLQLYVYPELAGVPEFPNGNLGPATRYNLQANGPVRGLTMADLNGDGVGDIIVTLTQYAIFALSDGKGGLEISTGLAVTRDGGMMRAGVVVTDLDGNGTNDLVGHVERWYGGAPNPATDRRDHLRVWFGDGRGGISHIKDMAAFGVQDYVTGLADYQEPSDIIADDFNNDGLIDVAMAAVRVRSTENVRHRFVVIYLKDDEGSLVESQVLPVGAEYITSIDANLDGRRDIVGVEHSSPFRVQAYVQDNDGKMQPMVEGIIKTYAYPISPVGADLDGDGQEDLVLAHRGYGWFTFHLRSGGGFSERRFVNLLRADGQPVIGEDVSNHAMAVIDLNGDGCKDVVIAAGMGGLQVFLGTNCLLHRTTGGNQARRRL